MRDRREFETKRHSAIAALEHQLSQAPDQPEQWARLARIRLQQGRGAEALDAMERALWERSAAETELALLELGGLPGEDQATKLLERALSGADVSGLAATLRAQEDDLRRRTTWTLLRLARANGLDPAQRDAARGRILDSLRAGLRAQEVPAFVARCASQPAALQAWKDAERDAIAARVRDEV